MVRNSINHPCVIVSACLTEPASDTKACTALVDRPLAALCAASVSRALEETGKETGIQPPGIPVEAGTPVIVDTVPVVPGSPEIPYEMGVPVPASEVPEKTTKKVDTVPVVADTPKSSIRCRLRWVLR